MRYEDASGTDFTADQAEAPSTLIARNDVDVILAGQYGPATGNAISGAGTISGSAGADLLVAGASITAIQGAGGTDTTFSGGQLQVAGQYGLLTINAQGAYSYVRNQGTPDGVSDVFTYTLASRDGDSDVATLAINIGKTATIVQANAVQVVPGPDGVVTLPPGVELSDIHVVGRNLVVDLPDGTQMIIIDGAVFVPQLVLGTVEVPSSNLAALLINSEPVPAAGPPQSSGGNFALPPPPLDPGVPLGDLLPPTDLSYTPPTFDELANAVDEEITVIIVTPDNPAGAVNATDSVDEAGLPARLDDEPEGSGEEAAAGANGDPSEATAGTIVIDAPDGLESVTINGVVVTAVGQTIAGTYGTLTITSINGGQISYTYVLLDNTSGDNTSDLFTVVVTDDDGDTATATLTVSIVDDVPTARNDTDTLGADELTADGNVMTGVGTTSGAAGVDTVGADDALVTGVHQGTTGAFTAVSGAGVTINGQYGTLTIFADGSYEYVRNPEAPDNVTEVFTYQLTDGDGDTSTATLTITIPNLNEPPIVRGSTTNVSEEGLPNGNPDTAGTPDTTNDASVSGSIFIDDPDGDSVTVRLQVPNPDPGLESGGDPIVWSVSADGHTLTGTADGNVVITVTINNAGGYDVVLSGPIDHASSTTEDALSFTIPVTVDDGTAPPVATTIVVSVEDDSPLAKDDTDSVVEGANTTGNVLTGV